MSTLRRVEPLRAWDVGDVTEVLARGGRVLRFEGESAELARAALGFFALPGDRDALLEHLAALAGAARDAIPTAPVDALVALLRREGVLVEAPAPRAVRAPGRRIVLAVTGAVAAVDAPALARILLARGHRVRVAMSGAARRFVARGALEAITHAPVHRSLWGARGSSPAAHIDLATWAELVAVYPCSATTLARAAQGDCSDLVAATLTATRALKVVAPSMNAAMLGSAAVQRNLAALRGDGVIVVHPGVGDEVALRPDARDDMLGPAIAPQAFADVLDRVLADRAPPWERAYRDGDEHPWSVERDDDLGAMLREHAPPATHPRVLDAGTGSGAVALALADAGYAVTAIDLSPSAIERAAARDGGGRVTWVVDDAASSRVRGRFDVVHDRGCLHALDAGARARYRAQVAAWLRPGGVWALKVHAREAPDLGTARFDEAAIDELEGAEFARIALRRCAFGGPVDRPAFAALLLRR